MIFLALQGFSSTSEEAQERLVSELLHTAKLSARPKMEAMTPKLSISVPIQHKSNDESRKRPEGVIGRVGGHSAFRIQHNLYCTQVIQAESPSLLLSTNLSTCIDLCNMEDACISAVHRSTNASADGACTLLRNVPVCFQHNHSTQGYSVAFRGEMI